MSEVYQPLLTWNRAQEKLPWGIIVLLGGGFALAKACKVKVFTRPYSNQNYLLLMILYFTCFVDACGQYHKKEMAALNLI